MIMLQLYGGIFAAILGLLLLWAQLKLFSIARSLVSINRLLIEETKKKH